MYTGNETQSDYTSYSEEEAQARARLKSKVQPIVDEFNFHHSPEHNAILTAVHTMVFIKRYAFAETLLSFFAKSTMSLFSSEQMRHYNDSMALASRELLRIEVLITELERYENRSRLENADNFSQLYEQLVASFLRRFQNNPRAMGRCRLTDIGQYNRLQLVEEELRFRGDDASSHGEVKVDDLEGDEGSWLAFRAWLLSLSHSEPGNVRSYTEVLKLLYARCKAILEELHERPKPYAKSFELFDSLDEMLAGEEGTCLKKAATALADFFSYGEEEDMGSDCPCTCPSIARPAVFKMYEVLTKLGLQNYPGINWDEGRLFITEKINLLKFVCIRAGNTLDPHLGNIVCLLAREPSVDISTPETRAIIDDLPELELGGETFVGRLNVSYIERYCDATGKKMTFKSEHYLEAVAKNALAIQESVAQYQKYQKLLIQKQETWGKEYGWFDVSEFFSQGYWRSNAYQKQRYNETVEIQNVVNLLGRVIEDAQRTGEIHSLLPLIAPSVELENAFSYLGLDSISVHFRKALDNHLQQLTHENNVALVKCESALKETKGFNIQYLQACNTELRDVVVDLNEVGLLFENFSEVDTHDYEQDMPNTNVTKPVAVDRSAVGESVSSMLGRSMEAGVMQGPLSGKDSLGSATETRARSDSQDTQVSTCTTTSSFVEVSKERLPEEGSTLTP